MAAGRKNARSARWLNFYINPAGRSLQGELRKAFGRDRLRLTIGPPATKPRLAKGNPHLYNRASGGNRLWAMYGHAQAPSP